MDRFIVWILSFFVNIFVLRLEKLLLSGFVLYRNKRVGELIIIINSTLYHSTYSFSPLSQLFALPARGVDICYKHFKSILYHSPYSFSPISRLLTLSARGVHICYKYYFHSNLNRFRKGADFMYFFPIIFGIILAGSLITCL